MSRYLITGGAGFIGSHLADLLTNNGHKVKVLDDLSTGDLSNISHNKEIEFTQGSILNLDTLKDVCKGIDGIFHLAAVASVQKSIDMWHYCHQVNLTGTVNIFLQAAIQNIPVVYASSAAVYGPPNELPLSETSLLQPFSPYAVDKYACELQAKVFGSLKGLKSFGLRFFNVYGSRQNRNSDYSGVISIFKQLALENKELTIFGDGNQSRDFIHVSDVVEALYLAINAASKEAQVTNICTGNSYTINELTKIITKVLNVKGVKYLPAQAGSIKESQGSPLLAKKLLKFEAKRGFEEALSEFLLE
ncbi:MAG: UDP-glucose 4-epimerase [Rickettsiaceae bacterium]|jgi:UDP-glucose 4-epimerase|nr:UDP-glucose 4-epimerase [Rickettsiaceae bacterium]